MLIQLGRPRFRISCREADWLGENDLQKAGRLPPRIQRSPPCGWIPLTLTDVENILRESLGVSDPKAFVEQAHEQGVDGLLFNPKGLELLVAAVHLGSGWPNSRIETFELACVQMARECNRNTAMRDALVFRSVP